MTGISIATENRLGWRRSTRRPLAFASPTPTARGLYTLGCRAYDPCFGRFLSPDSPRYADFSSPGGLSMYCYCYNNPVAYSDTSGHMPIFVAALIGMVAGLTVTFIKDWADDGKPFNGSVDWRDYVGAGAGGAIAGLGTGFVSTIIFSGLGSAVQSAIMGDISSFGDFAFALGIGAVVGAIGYAVSAGIQAIGDKKVMGVIGNSMNKLKINHRLASAGFKNLKVGKLGYQNVYDALYRHFGFEAMEYAWEIALDFGSGFLPW